MKVNQSVQSFKNHIQIDLQRLEKFFAYSICSLSLLSLSLLYQNNLAIHFQ